MKLDLNFQFKKIDGSDYPGDLNHIGKNFADLLFTSNLNNSIMIHDWAMKLWNKEAVEIEGTVYLDKFIQLVDNDTQLNVMAKAQLITKLNEYKENCLKSSIIL